MSQKQNQTIQPSREHLDADFWEDVAFIFYNIHDCKELDEIWSDDWDKHCPLCGAPVVNGKVRHRKQ